MLGPPDATAGVPGGGVRERLVQGLTEEVHLAVEQASAVHDRGWRGDVLAEAGEQRLEVRVGVELVGGRRVGHHLVQRRARGQRPADLVLFTADVVLASSGRRRRPVPCGPRAPFAISRDNTRRSPRTARRGRSGRDDPRRVLLAVAVDAAVALLDADQAPRDVEVDQLVALRVQVDAFGGDVAGDQHADRVRPA